MKSSDKLINGLIIVLFVLSVWTIFSVEFECQLIKINVSILTCSIINKICLNLSYSYCAGFIIYGLTVVLPLIKRKRICKLQVDHLISDYYRRSLYQYFSFCSGRKADDQYVKNYRNNCPEITRYIHSENENFIQRYENLRELSGINKSFINLIIPYIDYLSIKQLTILTNIRIDQFDMLVDSRKNWIEEGETDPGQYKYLYDIASSVIKLIDEIYNSTKKQL